MGKLNKIATRRKQYERDTVQRVDNQNKSRQMRLKALVDLHGSDCVAAACGLKVSTVVQYCRVTRPPSISEDTVTQAETILQGL